MLYIIINPVVALESTFQRYLKGELNAKVN